MALAVLLPLLAILAWASSVAVTLASTDGAVQEARREMSSGKWESARQALEQAQNLSPDDPTVLELKGILHSSRRESAHRMSEGIDHFKRSLRQRPVSPYTWANLAEAKYLQGHTDDEFELALRQAALLGPAEPDVQRVVAEYGLAVWAEVAPDTRQAIDRMVAAGIRRNPLETLQISERRGRLAVACRHLVGAVRATDPRPNPSCQSTETTP